MDQLGIEPPLDEEDAVVTKIFIIIEKELVGFITFEDQIRESSYEAIEVLKKENIKVSLLTGDNEKVAKDVADKLGSKRKLKSYKTKESL